jgi:hypothetical protein
MIFDQRIVSRQIDKIRSKGKINFGPFAGVSATEDCLQHCWMRLLGIYEFYLHGCIERAIGFEPNAVVDVGASTGYYSIGMAFRLPRAKHIAFEMQQSERDSFLRTASKISVPIDLKTECKPQDLIQIAEENRRGFLIIDCEGAERELLGDAVCPGLRDWMVLLEVHDWHAPGAGEEILQRFGSSHDIQILWSRNPSPWEFRSVVPWPFNYYCAGVLSRICDEGRGGGMRFFFMVPKVN